MQRRLIYPVLGAVAALGVPLGLIGIRAATHDTFPSTSWAWQELTLNLEFYAYPTGFCFVAMMLFGWLLGRKEDSHVAQITTDPLTGLSNRRGLEQRLAGEIARSIRYESPLSVLMIDLDGLKGINDHLGHRAGDAAISAVADSLRLSCRAGDTPMRYGGDEFVVVAPATTATEAAELARRVRNNLRRNSIQRVPKGSRVSVSIGVADLRSAADITTPHTLICAADAALYQAKARAQRRGVDPTLKFSHLDIPPENKALQQEARET